MRRHGPMTPARRQQAEAATLDAAIAGYEAKLFQMADALR